MRSPCNPLRRAPPHARRRLRRPTPDAGAQSKSAATSPLVCAFFPVVLLDFAGCESVASTSAVRFAAPEVDFSTDSMTISTSTALSLLKHQRYTMKGSMKAKSMGSFFCRREARSAKSAVKASWPKSLEPLSPPPANAPETSATGHRPPS